MHVYSTFMLNKHQQVDQWSTIVEGDKGHAFVKEILFLSCRFSLTLIDTLDTLVVSISIYRLCGLILM